MAIDRVEIPFIVEKPVTIGADTVVTPAVNATCLVTIRGGGAATVYGAQTGSGTVPNPITINAQGRIEGWVPEGSYDLLIAGTGFTTYTQPFEAASGLAALNLDGVRLLAGSVSGSALQNGSVTGTKIGTQTITRANLDPDVLPIGFVMEWWRPNNTIAIPTGWEIADGRIVSAGNHSYPGGGSITLPDLRNRMILGADNPGASGYIGDGGAGTVGDGTSASGTGHPNAPGIRGVGGSNSFSGSHTHSISAHTHSISSVGDHQHQIPDHTHFLNLNTGNEFYTNGGQVYAPSQAPWILHAHNVQGWTGGSSLGAPLSYGAGTHSHGGSTGSAGGGTTGSGGSSGDNRSLYYGLLRIIKVKNT